MVSEGDEEVVHVHQGHAVQTALFVVVKETHTIKGMRPESCSEESFSYLERPQPWRICQSIHGSSDFIYGGREGAGFVQDWVSWGHHEEAIWSLSFVLSPL